MNRSQNKPVIYLFNQPVPVSLEAPDWMIDRAMYDRARRGLPFVKRGEVAMRLEDQIFHAHFWGKMLSPLEPV